MEMQTLEIDVTNDRSIGFGHMDDMKKRPSCFKILTHFIKGNSLKTIMEIILSILRELEYLESLVKIIRKKKDDSLKSSNLIKLKETLAIHKVCINKCHQNKTLHLLIKVNNHLIEGLVDIGTLMSIMVVRMVHEII